MADHDEIWTEEYCSKRFGAFFTDYKFEMQPDLGLSIGNGSYLMHCSWHLIKMLMELPFK